MFNRFREQTRRIQQSFRQAAERVRPTSSSQCGAITASYTQAQQNLANSGCAAPAQSGATAQNSECAAKLQTVNQHRSDLTSSQTDYDTTCDPVGAFDRRAGVLRAAFTDYKTATNKATESLEAVFNTRLAAIDKLAVAHSELRANLADLTAQYNAMDKKNRDLDQAARAQRRLFLDDDPQSGVGGAPGVRTRDDRVLLAFWINYVAALVAVAIFFCWKRGSSRMETALTTVVVVGVGYLIAYYFVASYA